MPARLPHRLLVPVLLALAGCSNGVAAPVAPSGPAPVAIAESAAPSSAPAPAASPTGRMLTGKAAFEGRVPERFDVQAFALGRPGQVIAAGGGNVIAPGGGNVIAPGGGNVIAPGGGNYRTAATATAEGAFAIPLPDGVAPGALVKLVVTTPDHQTLIAVARVPDDRHVAQTAEDVTTINMATTLAYLMLSKRLEGAGQAAAADHGPTFESLLTTITAVYTSLTTQVREALTSAPEGERRTALSDAMAAAFAAEAPAGTESLSSDGADAMVALAPTIGQAFSDAVAQLSSGIRQAVNAGASTPDAAFIGPIRFGQRVSLGQVFKGSTPYVAPAKSETGGVEVQDGEVTNPTTGPTLGVTP